jgi:hypothetical protein
MSPEENQPKPPFRLGSSAKLNQEIRELAKLAESLGKKRAFLKSLRQITTRLKHAPFTFGECRYHLAESKLRFQIGAISPVAVHFAIHEESPNVILLKVHLLGS